MAIGDQNDCFNRIKSTLPVGWFGDTALTPIVNALVQGLAWAMAYSYSMYAYAKLQTRIKTATDGWLDMIAGDWFGAFLQRRAGQSDTSYRNLILSWLFRIRATRSGLVQMLTDVTGRAPIVFEKDRPLDAGAYSTNMWGYNRAGGYGTQSLPRNTCFVTAFRPTVGTDQYGVTDADIYAAVNAVRPVCSIVWTQIAN